MALVVASGLEFSCKSFTVYVDSEHKVWFQGLESCNQLELSNPTLTLQRHVSPQYRCQIADGRGKPAWFIKEPGLYQLIFASKSEQAEKFREWVFEQVLPSIRKTGSYVATSADQQHFQPFGLTIQQKIKECDQALESADIGTGRMRQILLNRKALQSVAAKASVLRANKAKIDPVLKARLENRLNEAKNKTAFSSQEIWDLLGLGFSCGVKEQRAASALMKSLGWQSKIMYLPEFSKTARRWYKP
jgi:prophage antirepressor-like protein